MAPLKFEDNMREKLEQRSIEPSSESWNKLASLLDQKEEKKKKNYWFLGIAAGFIGVLISVTFLVKSDVDNKDTQEYVETTEQNNTVDQNTTTQLVQTETPKADSKMEIVEKKSPQISNDKNKTNALVSATKMESAAANDSGVITPKEKKISGVAEATDHSPKEETAVSEIITIDSIGIQQKIIAVAAQVEALEKNNVQVTDEEIDNLLLQAQKEITMNQFLKTNKVNASDLLSTVEAELDETFKEKVFEALKTGFQKFKTSVVERDN